MALGDLEVILLPENDEEAMRDFIDKKVGLLAVAVRAELEFYTFDSGKHSVWLGPLL